MCGSSSPLSPSMSTICCVLLDVSLFCMVLGCHCSLLACFLFLALHFSCGQMCCANMMTGLICCWSEVKSMTSSGLASSAGFQCTVLSSAYFTRDDYLSFKFLFHIFCDEFVHKCISNIVCLTKPFLCSMLFCRREFSAIINIGYMLPEWEVQISGYIGGFKFSFPMVSSTLMFCPQWYCVCLPNIGMPIAMCT